MIKPSLSLVAVAILAAGCATVPLGPRVLVMPAAGKPFDQFQAEDRMCRQHAEEAVGGGRQHADDHAVATTVIATAVGALAGAALGGHDGAAVGAGVGLVTGAAAGGGESAVATRDMQRRYDIAYQQCMYSMGNQLPGYYSRPVAPPPAARPAYYPPSPSAPASAATAPSAGIPPPPPGTPPPPPPDAR